jgi:uncharacterized protein YukE
MSDTYKTDTSVYIETEALSGWSSKMAEINTSTESILDQFATAVTQLKDDWQGNSANGFETAMNNCLKSAKNKHGEMGQVENFLIKVIDTMQKQ